MALRVEIVSAEGAIYSGDAKMVFAPARMGEIGIAPRHAPLLTDLKPGSVRVEGVLVCLVKDQLHDHAHAATMRRQMQRRCLVLPALADKLRRVFQNLPDSADVLILNRIDQLVLAQVW